MITELTITPEYGDSLTLSVPGPSDGYLVKEIEGLDPVPVAMASEVVASMAGEIYQASRLEKRNIVIKIDFDLNYASTTVEQRRNRLYLLGLGKQLLTLTFTSDDLGEVMIQGRVEEFDAPLNTENPSATISVICFTPDFQSTTETIVTSTSSETIETFEYEGSSPTGLLIRLYGEHPMPINFLDMTFTHQASSRTIGRIRADDYFQPIIMEEMTISTIPGDKYFRMDSDGRSRLNSVDFDSLLWPTLLPGMIDFLFLVSFPDITGYDYDLVWTNKYGAI